jgi:hypothetical protein
MTFSEYETYFLNGAISNKTIAHNPPGKISFRSVDIEQLLSDVKSSTEGMSLFLEAPEIKGSDSGSDNPRKLYNCAFSILEENTKKGDFDETRSIMDRTMLVAEQFIARIHNDFRKHKIDPNHPNKIKGFDLNSVSINKVGPIMNNQYGWRVTFTLNQLWPNRVWLNNNDWTNDTAAST